MADNLHALEAELLQRRSAPSLLQRLRILPSAPPPNPGPVVSDIEGPTYPIQGWRDALRNPLQALIELGRGFVDPMNAQTHPNAPLEHIGAIASAAAPVFGAVKAGGALKAAAGQADDAARGIRAYHGSPHDFDRFSLSKIGTGEGAQAYGHGLYFAENEGVARNYRDALSPRAAGNLELPLNLSMADPVRDRDMFEATLQRVTAQLDDWRNRGVDKVAWMRDEITDAERVKAAVETALSDPKSVGSAGRMYEVQLNVDPETLLDWDAPYMSQPAARRLPLTVAKETEPSDSKWLVNMGEHTINGFDTKREAQAWVNAATGADVYRAQRGQAASVVNRRFMDRDIPGIKYLDGGSRAAGTGTRNYVIFDDALVTILKKYGVALPAIEALRQKAAANNGQLTGAEIQEVL